MIELRPDKRHLIGGLAAAALFSLYLVYTGMGSPGDVFYAPEYAAHQGQGYDEVGCGDCHAPWQKAPDAKCLGCHNHKEIARALTLPAAKAVIPDISASAKFHTLLAGRLCSECHVEHVKSELARVLKLPKDVRARQTSYHQLVHGQIPAAQAGADQCGVCHTQAELDAVGVIK